MLIDAVSHSDFLELKREAEQAFKVLGLVKLCQKCFSAVGHTTESCNGEYMDEVWSFPRAPISCKCAPCIQKHGECLCDDRELYDDHSFSKDCELHIL